VEWLKGGWRGTARWGQNAWAGAALGLALVALAAVLRLALDPLLGRNYAFVTFYLAVIAAAALGRFVGFATALVASIVVAWYAFLPARLSFGLPTRAEEVALIAFVFVGGLSGAVTAGLRRALDRLDRAERAQRLLIDELNHRVKNTLSTVQSLAWQTARGADSLSGFEQLFDSRLQALSRAHNVLTEQNWRGAELGELVRETLAVQDPEGRRTSVEGPPVRLSPNAAVTVNLAIHELATNALKHGAFARPDGRVEVRWRAEGPTLVFLWRESGLEGAPPPAREGFGARLLKAAARELNARVEPRHTPQGYVYEWRVPFSAKVQPG
jgi:two-component sensor histidine kinase